MSLSARKMCWRCSALCRGPWHHRPNGGGGHRIGGGTVGVNRNAIEPGTDIPIHRHPGTVCPARPLKMNVDERGSFTELVHTLNAGQVSINISKPGITKGQHWHNTQFEQFIVVKGHGLIHHSDRGCQYCCDKYVKLLQDNRILISMTESGNPRENAIAKRVNGILKTKWLNDEHFIGMFDARRRIAEVIDIYNNKRPHMSLNYLTPRDAHKMHGEQVRRWRNYYKTHESPEQTKEKILSLTTDVRTPIQTSGL